MNKLFIEGSGFPADNRTWRFIRDMINQVHELTALGGTNYILKGCEVDNGQVAAGFVVINGELLPFEAGAEAANVSIYKTVDSVTYLEDIAPADGQGDIKETYFTRVARFGNDGEGTIAFEDLKRIDPLVEVQRRLVPKQSAIPFWGAVADIPEGWQLCDGTNSTPDLSGLFIVGLDPADADHDEIGKQGGAKEVTLQSSHIPSHNHTGSAFIPPHKHQLPNTVYTKEGASGDDNTFSNTNNIGKVDVTETEMNNGINVNFSTNHYGGGQAHENIPPYYTMAYITYVGVN